MRIVKRACSRTPRRNLAKFRSVIAQVVRSETREVYLYFQADGTFHGKDSASQQLGFVATYFDSSDGSCANDCSGFRGDCDDGVRGDRAGRLAPSRGRREHANAASVTRNELRPFESRRRRGRDADVP